MSFYSDNAQFIEDALLFAQKTAGATEVSTESVLAAMQLVETRKVNKLLEMIDSRLKDVENAVYHSKE